MVKHASGSKTQQEALERLLAQLDEEPESALDMRRHQYHGTD